METHPKRLQQEQAEMKSHSTFSACCKANLCAVLYSVLKKLGWWLIIFKREFFFLVSNEDDGEESNIPFSTQLKPTGEEKMVWSNHIFAALDSAPSCGRKIEKSSSIHLKSF